MGYLGRRIGLSQDNGDSNPGAAGGAVGGGLLDLFAHGYFERQGDIYNAPGAAQPSGLTATGGVISDYTSGSDVYRAHIFTSSGALNVTELGNLGNTVDYLVVAGGGGNQSSPAGSNRESGSGAGGLLSSHPDVPATFKQTQVTISSTGNINIVVGGGAGGKSQGSSSSIGFSSPVSTVGGGHGANSDGSVGGPGGSGGGNWYSSATPGQATNYPGPTQQGYPGGTQGGTNNWTGGAGGGAGAQGANNGTSYSAGRTISITGSSVEYSRGGKSNSYPSTPRNESGIFNTGGGASGVGNGGSGIVVVRYKIAELTATAKATGGAISFAGGKTIHAFTTSGDLNNTSGSTITNVDYLVVAGGGGGGAANGSADGSAGAGAGGLRTSHPDCPAPLRGSQITISTGPNTVVVGGGGAGGPFGPGNDGTSGANSSFTPSYVSTGGGYGSLGPGNGGTGGSGGGSSGGGSAGVGGAGNTPPVSPSQGNAGGDNGPNFGSGGGGGFISVGSDSPSNSGGPGGTGINLSIIGTSTGYAGGGGGGAAGPYRGSYSGGTATHGGGAGAPADGTNASTYQGGHGTMNVGGGGGGGGGSNSPEPVYPTLAPNGISGGNGGAGVVIIAYPS
jgi:hypothetical protein